MHAFLVSDFRLRAWAVLAPVLLAAFFLSGCKGDGKNGKPQVQAVLVGAAKAERRDVPLTVSGIGHVQAKRTVAVRSQVTGVLLSTQFTEGQDVRQGAPLFLIDPSPFEARLRQAEANLARDRTKADQSWRDYQRYHELVQKNVVSADEYERYKAAAEQAKAQVKAEEAEVVAARLNLGYCRIVSPTDGVTGLQKVKTGNLVNANTDVLVEINQIQPVLVRFSLGEAQLPAVRKHFGPEGLPARAVVPGFESEDEQGRLTVINNTVDPLTGMIVLQAEFANAHRKLWPGQFVNVTVTLAQEGGALTVPNPAVMSRQDGDAVFVVRPDSTVALVPVKVARVVNDQAVIAEGVSEGDVVVTDGQIRLFPGAPVKLREAAQEQGQEQGKPQ